uniref:LisH domain-containing protein n=1 Tax=Onchocerca volvulus TaxID=6282 RepID=A0A2K6VR43_ONCVO
MDSDVLKLKEAVIDKLRENGTLDRIQAELRCAVFLAIESNENNELKVDESKLKQKSGFSMIYHFLRQNRFLATAAVFEKEMHQKIIPLEELKRKTASTFCFQFFGDDITLSDSTSIFETEQKMKEPHSTIIRSSKTNDIDSNFMSYVRENNDRKSDVKTIERQQISNSESNTTLKSASSESEISRDENGTSNSSIRNERRDEKEIQNNRSFEKSTNDEIQKYNKENSSNLGSSTISEQQQQTSKISSTKISKDQQINFNSKDQFPKKITPPSSSYPRKLPPITSTSNESVPSTRLPCIPPLNRPPTQTRTVPFSRMLDTVLNSSSSNKSETDEDIVEEIIPDDLLRSDNNSDASISF